MAYSYLICIGLIFFAVHNQAHADTLTFFDAAGRPAFTVHSEHPGTRPEVFAACPYCIA